MTAAAESDEPSTLVAVPDSSPPSSPDLDVEALDLNTSSPQITTTKKKKKRKPKKSAKQSVPTPSSHPDNGDNKPPALCITRNKHWKYISSYHGPWLQLPIELLDSLSILNEDPTSLVSSDTRLPSSFASQASQAQRLSERSSIEHSDSSSLVDPRLLTSVVTSPSFPTAKSGRPLPPPIDPGVFRNVIKVRRLIDEAAELSVRASSGMSAVELHTMRNPPGLQSPWSVSQTLGIGAPNNAYGGRNVTMSAMRIHRLRALAVQKLAQAYRADEIASSVMVMQGGTVFDDLAQRVLKVDPNDTDAKYVHFFHEKIPSRQLAECTTTQLLDQLIAIEPQRLEYYRTRGIVHCFREEFPQATKDFTYALKEARALRKAKLSHRTNILSSEHKAKGSKKKGRGGQNRKGAAELDPSESTAESTSTDTVRPHPSTLPEAPEPLEPQLLFLRGAASLQHAIFLIEEAIVSLEGISKDFSFEGAELRLCNLDNGRYGGVEIGNPDGPLGRLGGPKILAYQSLLAEPSFQTTVHTLLQKSIRDHEKFLSHFDSIEGAEPAYEGNLAQRTEYAFFLSESTRPGTQGSSPSARPTTHELPLMISTYHPLLVEAHFTILLCSLMLGDFPGVLPRLQTSAALLDGLEGHISFPSRAATSSSLPVFDRCPVFLPPRSMAQAEFVEILERLVGGWRHGIQPHSLSSVGNGKGRLAIEEKPVVHIPIASALGDEGASSSSHCPSPVATPTNSQDLKMSLDCARILLAPVMKRQKARAEEKAAEAAHSSGEKKPIPINIPLHGPRVEVMLAWMAAIHLAQLETVT